MVNINYEIVEQEITSVISEISNKLKIEVTIGIDSCPGSIGIKSQILITIMGRLENTLGISIPHNCYIFHDKKTKRQLSIKEAAQKLIKEAKDGN